LAHRFGIRAYYFSISCGCRKQTVSIKIQLITDYNKKNSILKAADNFLCFKAMASERQQRGLSQRGEKNVAVIMPKISSAVTERTTQKNTKIDLSTAENWLIRPEVVNLCKEAIDTKFNAKVIRNVCLKPDNLMQHANNIQHFSYQSGFAGDSDVIDAFASFFNNHFKPHTLVESSQIATATGAAGCLDAVLYNICDPGDGVLVPTPYWSKPFIDATSWSFNSYVHNLADAFDFLFQARSSVTPIPVNVSNLGFTLTEAILPALEKAYEIAQCPIKGLILTNPHNPLGQCYPKLVLEGCLKFCNAHNIHFVSDEIYALTSFACPDIPNPVPFVSALSIDVEKLGCNRSRVHTIWSTSKDFGQSGVRMVVKPPPFQLHHGFLTVAELLGVYSNAVQSRLGRWACLSREYSNLFAVCRFCHRDAHVSQTSQPHLTEFTATCRRISHFDLFLHPQLYSLYP